MSIQTNFRAQDMLGVAKPAVKKVTPKYVAPVVKVEPVVVEPAVSVVYEVEDSPTKSAEDLSTKE